MLISKIRDIDGHKYRQVDLACDWKDCDQARHTQYDDLQESWFPTIDEWRREGWVITNKRDHCPACTTRSRIHKTPTNH